MTSSSSTTESIPLGIPLPHQLIRSNRIRPLYSSQHHSNNSRTYVLNNPTWTHFFKIQTTSPNTNAPSVTTPFHWSMSKWSKCNIMKKWHPQGRHYFITSILASSHILSIATIYIYIYNNYIYNTYNLIVFWINQLPTSPHGIPWRKNTTHKNNPHHKSPNEITTRTTNPWPSRRFHHRISP